MLCAGDGKRMGSAMCRGLEEDEEFYVQEGNESRTTDARSFIMLPQTFTRENGTAMQLHASLFV